MEVDYRFHRVEFWTRRRKRCDFRAAWCSAI